jgi:hypothetical protein
MSNAKAKAKRVAAEKASQQRAAARQGLPVDQYLQVRQKPGKAHQHARR